MIEVILPVLNEAQALPWVLSRMPDGYAPLVVDNGSTDGSGALAGEVSASCDNEAANFITINLLHRLVEGELDVEKARAAFAEITAAWALNREAPLAEGSTSGFARATR